MSDLCAMSETTANGGPPTPLVQLRDVERHYHLGVETVRALDGVDLEIEDGAYVAIMGKSGSGKSTLMNILGCLDTPTGGAYRLAQRAVETLEDDDLARLRNEVLGFVFQSFNLLPRMNAVDNVALPLLYADPERKVSSDERRELARDALVRVGLGDRLDHVPNQLSGGQRQRVAIARALVNRPRLLLADEPTGNLDSRTTEDVMDLIDRLAAEGTTVVLVTHEDDIAERAHRLVELQDGRILRDERS